MRIGRVAVVVTVVATLALASTVPVGASGAGRAGASGPPATDPGSTGSPSTDPAADPCPGALRVVGRVGDGPTMCTAGPAPVEASRPPGSAAVPEVTSGIQCYGNGTDGARVQLLYAHPRSIDRFTTFAPKIVRRAGQIEAIFDASAVQTGGRRHVRWVTDANCNVDVRSVVIPDTAIALSGFDELVRTLAAQGFSSNDRKYLVWVDTGSATTTNPVSCAGLGTLYPDESDSPRNSNNVFTGVARVEERCLFAALDAVAAKVEAHELTHTLGAVQSGTPHHSRSSHCTDDHDIMCYDDGAGLRIVCASTSNEMRLDCNHDDYFSTNPTAGGYLDTHWNLADSRWLEPGPGIAFAPGPPTSVSGVPGNEQVEVSWSPPSSDGGAPVSSYRVYRDGQVVRAVTTPATRSFIDTGLANGTTHAYQVTAVNSAGEGPRSASISVMAGTPRPDAQVARSRSGPFVGADVYSTSVTPAQTLSQNVARGGTATSYVRVQNDRPGVDSLTVKGVDGGSAGYRVRYLRGSTDVTAAVEDGTYRVDDLAPGASVQLVVEITATSNAVAGGTHYATVTVKSATTTTIKDVVRAQVVRS